MKTAAPPPPALPATAPSAAELLPLLRLRTGGDLLEYLHARQPELLFRSVGVAVPQEPGTHALVPRGPQPARPALLKDTALEKRLWDGADKAVLEKESGEVVAGVALSAGGRVRGAVLLTFHPGGAAALPAALAWLEARREALALALEGILAREEQERQLREKSMHLVVINALTSEPDYGQMVLSITAAINALVPCDFFTVPALSGRSEFFLSGYHAIRRDDGFELLNRNELLEALELDLDTYRSIAKAQAPLYHTPRIFPAEAYRQLAQTSLISNRFIHLLGMQEAIFVPVRLGNRAVATMALLSRRAGTFGPKDLQLLLDLAGQLTGHIERLLAFEQKEVLEKALRRENSLLIRALNEAPQVAEMIGQSPAMRQLLDDLQRVAPTDATVLIGGETGTGKELAARAVHHLSGRKNRPLIKVNCAALPAQLIESELFGHEKGAFTGATERRIGKFELAHGGTIFLDEIGELPLELQAKLLRVLQEHEVERIGGRHPIRLDIRVIAATNRDLPAEARAGRFRPDLYYRLNTFPLRLPPLRERREDIPRLAEHFAGQYARKMGKPVRGLSPKMTECLLRHDWPGNVRELEHVIEQAVILSTGPLLALARSIKPATPAAAGDAPAPPSLPHPPASLEAIDAAYLESQRHFLLEVLRASAGRIRGPHGAAARLGLKPTTLEARLKKLGIAKYYQ
jgi:transcriptional regulator with GAF, ATPase, and Fis domain